MQTQTCRRKGGRDGAAMFTVIMIILAIGTLLGITLRAATQRVFMTRKLADRVRALAIAEAGVNQAYDVLRTNFASRLNDNAFPLKSYGGGTYDVTVRPVSNSLAIVTSLGTYGSASETVVLDVKDYGVSTAQTTLSNMLDYAILGGGYFDFGGCGSYSSSNGATVLHANGYITVRGSAQMGLNIESSTSVSIGNNKTINGTVWAPSLSYTPSKVTITGGATVGPVPLVTIPDLDLTPHYNHALANGQVYNGNVNLSSSFTPPGGIMWVNGTLSLGGNTTYTGSFFATGSINVPGNGAINNSNPYPTIVSRDGDVSFTGQKNVQGLIYVKTGSYSQTGGNSHTGQLIVKGNINKGGNSDVLTYNRTALIPPNSNNNAANVVGVSAWQK